MTADTGKTLMLRFQESGDSAACEALFQMYRLPLWRFFMRICGSSDMADDLSQRTWLKLLGIAERGAYRPSAAATFKTYLFTIGRNMVIDDGRAMRSRVVHLDIEAAADDLTTNATSLELAVEHLQAGEQLRFALQKLPFDQREVLAMWAGGFSFDEIAALVGVSRNTVIGRKRYGLEKLRASFGSKPAAELETSGRNE